MSANKFSERGFTKDFPSEGFKMQKTETLLSPSLSQIEAQIAAADSKYVDELQKGAAKLKMTVESRTEAAMKKAAHRMSSATSYSTAHHRNAQLLLGAKRGLSMSITVRDIFGDYMDPTDVLGFYHKHNSNVLTEDELELIQDRTLSIGSRDGAFELYDLLQKYGDWLPCTLEVLDDPEVGQDELAELIRLHLGLEKLTRQILEDPENKERVLALLKDKLRMKLEPLKILHLFHKYDPNVLVDDDIEVVRKITIKHGNEVGTDELLERLVLYPGWYPCLMLVLNDSEVGLGDLAELLADCIAAEFEELEEAAATAMLTLFDKFSDLSDLDEDMVHRLMDEKKEAEAKKQAASLRVQAGRRWKDDSKLRIKKKKATMEESSSEESSGDEMPGSRTRTGKARLPKALRKLLKSKNCPRYTGLDWDKPLGPHLLKHLPTQGGLCAQNAQLLKDRLNKEVPVLDAPPPVDDPWLKGKQYVEKNDIMALLTFMMSRVVLERPYQPLDYLIELTREIDRQNRIRQEWLQMEEDRVRAERQAAEGNLEPSTDSKPDEPAEDELTCQMIAQEAEIQGIMNEEEGEGESQHLESERWGESSSDIPTQP